MKLDRFCRIFLILKNKFNKLYLFCKGILLKDKLKNWYINFHLFIKIIFYAFLGK